MKIASFFKVPRNKQFNYAPRYYDKDKEKREARSEKIREELGIKEGEKSYAPDIRGRFQGNYSRRGHSPKKTPLFKMIIILITIGLLVAIFYLIFHYTSIMFENV